MFITKENCSDLTGHFCVTDRAWHFYYSNNFSGHWRMSPRNRGIRARVAPWNGVWKLSQEIRTPMRSYPIEKWTTTQWYPSMDQNRKLWGRYPRKEPNQRVSVSRGPADKLRCYVSICWHWKLCPVVWPRSPGKNWNGHFSPNPRRFLRFLGHGLGLLHSNLSTRSKKVRSWTEVLMFISYCKSV